MDNRDSHLIDQALKGIKDAKDAGFGEVVVKIQDHVVVNVKCEAQYQLTNKRVV